MANPRDAHPYQSSWVNGRWGSPPNSGRSGRQDGFRATHDDRPNGFANEGSPFEKVPVPQEPSSSGGSTLFSPFSLFGYGSRSNTNARAEGSHSAVGNRRVHSHGGPKSEHSDSRVFESRGANGGYSRSLNDLSRLPVQNETSSDELRVIHLRIASLENRNMKLEDDLRTEMRKFHTERMRADAVEKENREIQRKLEALPRENVRADGLEKENREIRKNLEALPREKVRADGIEKENREIRKKLEGFFREKVRADGFERDNREIHRKLEAEKVRADALDKKNREMQRKLESLSLEKVHADSLESEKREFQVKLKRDEQEIGELQSKLQEALAAKELEAAESRTLQNSLKDMRLENQELSSWKLEQERKTVQDPSSAGLRSKVADLTYAKGLLKKELQLTTQTQEETKRMKEQNGVLVVKIGALESQVQSLLERLQQRNTEVEELKHQLKPQVVVEAQVDEQEAREQALREQCSFLEQQMPSNPNARAVGGYSAGGTSGDLSRFPVQEETSSNEFQVISHQRIASLENLNKKLEDDLRTEVRKFHDERIRAESFEKENGDILRKLEGLYRAKVSADAAEKDNREIHERLYREKMRAYVFEKENQEMRRKLDGLSREKVPADAVEKENQEIEEGLYRAKVSADAVEKDNRRIEEGLYREKLRVRTENSRKS